MIARYDLSVELNSFDYYGWQAQVAAMGATEIVFDFLHVPLVSFNWRRFDSIIKPGPSFLGMKGRFGIDGENLASSRFRALAQFGREYGPHFPRLQAPLHCVKTLPDYTVTMRRQKIKPDRNSNEKVWRAFATEIGAVVIEDYDDVPMALENRMKLYSSAKMNFGIVCGPLTMCSLSIYPCVQFGYEWAWGNGFYEKTGINYGDPMPWLTSNQFTVWQTPTLDMLRHWFAEWNKC